mgnify:FL=1
MKDKKESKLNYKFLIMIAVIVPIILSVSYAYFLAKVSGDNTIIDGSATNKFDIDLITTNEGYINASDLLPISETASADKAAKGIFSVKTGSNDYKINYSLSLTDITLSDNLKSSNDLKWELWSSDTNTKISSGTFKNASSTLLLKNNIIINKNQTNNYELRIYVLETNTNQLELLDGTLSAKVTMDAEMINEAAE